jgi:uncharacterized membrane protein
LTAARNVPLNDALDAFGLQEMSAEQVEQRCYSSEQPWNGSNTVRTVANIAAFTLATSAAALAERTD